MQKLVYVTVAALAVAGCANAGVIERACLESNRSGTSPQLCGCIQNVADVTLTTRDQRLAAKFFAEPGKSQEIRTSDRRDHEAFWKKYHAFGSNAESYCS
ncbi:hypothetical protein E2L08_04085 [Palleronia sediminis]|uniref:Arginine transporter n=1 Tax=Palleronia sediminis TaxID=2547833 RepID=A0A4R6ACV5_9RHOB|nr:hypothetical protein [Palleronia sediminis]TDL81841.1 hypothetical protein E2L08_04085 [Palleronia sediminis]